jgi:putative ABC transport system permease protein
MTPTMARVTLRNLAAHKLRLVLTAVSVVLGVAMIAGTFMFTDTMSKQFDELFNSFGKGVAVDVRAKKFVDAGEDEQFSTRPPVPESMLQTLSRIDGVKKPPIGKVTGYAAVIGKNGKTVATQGPPQLGVNWTPGGDYTLKSGRAPAGPGEVAIDATTMKKAGYRVGERARILVQGPAQHVTIVGVIDTGNLMGASLSAFDTATAQRLMLKPGYFSDIQLGSTGVSETVLKERVAQALPGGFEAITGTELRAENKSDVAAALSFFQILLLVFGFIAIFVGAFIIFNTFSMLVAQRTRELALLRAIGADRRQVTRAVLGEAVGVALVGSTIGLVAGAGLALALQAISGIEGAGGLVFTATPVIWSYTVGLAITVLAAYFPARRAAKIPPVAAMRDDVALPKRSLRRRAGAGTVLTAGGAALMFLGLTDALPGNPLVPIGGGAFLIFLGVAMLAPVISKPVIRALAAAYPRLFGTPGRLARENALRNPRRTAATAAALMIGLALVSTINVVSSSAIASIGRSVDRQFGADYMIMPDGQSRFSPEAVRQVGETPGVERATPLYAGNVNLNGKRAAVLAGDTAGAAEGAKLEMVSGSTKVGGDGLLVDVDTAKSNRWTVGGTVPAQFPDGAVQRLRIAGIYAKNDLLGPRVLSERAYLAHTPQPMAVFGMVQVRTPDTATKQAIEQALRDYPNLRVQDRSEVKADFQRQLDQIVVFFTIMLAMSIIIAAVGVLNTLALSVIERTREIGLLRAVGTSRRQLRRMIRLESIVIAVFGALLGIGIGVSFGAAIQNGLAGEGLNVLAIPVGTLAIYVLLGGLIGVLAALWPAWRAGRMDVLRAIATE